MSKQPLYEHHPETLSQIVDIVADALDKNSPLLVEGSGTKSGLGAQVNAQHKLVMSGYQGVIDYQPEELVLVVKSGTRLEDIEELLAENGQMLAFEPPHLGSFYNAGHSGTIGGIVNTNLSGPRRISAGAVRDYVLGFEGVSGRAGAFKSGSKVMKNVTGYDLSKLICGSFGRLAILSDITLKILPRPQTAVSLAITVEGLDHAQKILSLAFASACEPSAGAVTRAKDGMFCAVVRLEGVSVSVQDRLKTLSGLLAQKGQAEILDEEASYVFWKRLRDVEAIHLNAEQVWKLSVTPSFSPTIIKSVEQQFEIDYALDWAGGLVWILGAGAELGRTIRTAINQAGGGHATLMRANEHIRQTVPVFQPQTDALQALESRIKTAFDPQHILNPHKMGTHQHTS